VSDYVISYQCY